MTVRSRAQQLVDAFAKIMRILPESPDQTVLSRVRPRFFDQIGYETMYASIGNNHFSLNLVIVRLTKIMNKTKIGHNFRK